MTPDIVEEVMEEFDEEFPLDYTITERGDSAEWLADPDKVRNFIKSALLKVKKDFIKSEIERMEGEKFVDTAEAGQFAMHSDGYNQALEDQIYHLQDIINDNK